MTNGEGDAEAQTTQRVQVQLCNHGELADQIAAWFHARYPHLDAICTASPGLTVDLHVPAAGEPGFTTWQAKLLAAINPLDVALELVAQALDGTQVEPCELLSVHMTLR